VARADALRRAAVRGVLLLAPLGGIIYYALKEGLGEVVTRSASPTSGTRST
jgi:hypothetical protein